MSLDDIDFAERYRQHMRRVAEQPKPASAWDRRAADMARRPVAGRYAEALLARMDLTGARSLLDVGCGPGTLCLPLAKQLEEVYGVDFSLRMLEELEANARRLGLDNVRPVLRAWEDDWSDIPPCDILLASRSSLVNDLEALLDKIHRHAHLRVYLTQLVGGQFIDPEIIQLLGVQRPAFPDHVYTLNLLHRRGIHPRLEYIETPSRLAGCDDFATFAERVACATGELSSLQREALRTWFDSDAERAQRGGAPLRWALLSWDVPH